MTTQTRNGLPLHSNTNLGHYGYFFWVWKGQRATKRKKERNQIKNQKLKFERWT